MDIVQQLFQAASVTQNNAYAPYSRYKVGAAVYAESGKIYASCNVENISFPCGTCAEAGAIAAMVSGGDKKIKAILISSDSSDLVYPCGACLQRIAEFSSDETIVYLADGTTVRQTYTLPELLPHNFCTGDISHE